jgi:hypothetical protein
MLLSLISTNHKLCLNSCGKFLFFLFQVIGGPGNEQRRLDGFAGLVNVFQSEMRIQLAFYFLVLMFEIPTDVAGLDLF